jgi:uncharacterized membrane protein (DUF106 family)
MADRSSENTKKKNDREIIKKINMAEHDMRVRTLGLSDRAAKFLVRTIMIIIPLAFIAFWLLHSK